MRAQCTGKRIVTIQLAHICRLLCAAYGERKIYAKRKHLHGTDDDDTNTFARAVHSLSSADRGRQRARCLSLGGTERLLCPGSSRVIRMRHLLCAYRRFYFDDYHISVGFVFHRHLLVLCVNVIVAETVGIRREMRSRWKMIKCGKFDIC